ncbi:hypothetical protein JNB71_01665 [Rhizobium herbae]|uniref:DUF5710 domain-containing protein n=1 Tax=Rhizobium herbae TaxID=508661 RepID=A0ABS7H650_9HYPH|nr:DUF5710 domain-containing protein [Rhizobium herbae]MBW9062012.1 hypothetical protein [Rhizobium herbae]
MTNWQTGEDGNVFEMIKSNGGPGLWIRRLTWGKTCARIVAAGEFTGAAPYFGNPSVLMDVFTLDGELMDELAPVPAPGTFKTWRRWPEPAWAGKIALRSLDDPRIAEALYRLDKKRQKLPGMQHAPKATDQDRLYLTVPFARKDEAKLLGARWAPQQRSWWLSSENGAAVERARQLGFLTKAQDSDS